MNHRFITTLNFLRAPISAIYCIFLILLHTQAFAKDTDVYSVSTKQNSYILLDNSGSMDFGVYEQNIDYGAMHDYLVSLHDPNPATPDSPADFYIADTINAGTPFFNNHSERRKIFLWKGKIGVTVANVDGAQVAFTGDAADPDYLWYSNDMIDTNTVIDSDGNLARSDPGKPQRLTIDANGHVLFDGARLSLGMDIKLHDEKKLYDGTVIDNGFGGLLNAPGYYFSGFAYDTGTNQRRVAQSGDQYVYFFVTGNWANMQAMYNLHYVATNAANPYPAGATIGSPAWKYELFPISEWSESIHSLKYPNTAIGDPTYANDGLHYDANLTEINTSRTIIRPGATQIKVHFSSIDINANGTTPDALNLYDKKNQLIVSYNNTNKPADGWSPPFTGDRVYLKLTSGATDQGTGYVIDKIAVTFVANAYLMQNRLDVAKDALNYTLDEFSNRMNWGFATFNYQADGSADGASVGPLLNPSVASATQVNNIKTVVSAIQPQHGTPLGEALQDVFERGYYGQRNILKEQLCRNNYIIVITDGYPSGDDSWNRISGITFTDLDGDGWTADPYQYTNPPPNYYDDVAHYLYTHSWLDHTAVADPQKSFLNVISHQIAFGAKHPLLQDTAGEAGGEYITAYNKTQLVAAFYALTLQMTNSVSFTAPVSSVDSANKIQNGTDMYLGLFLPETGESWAGNLKKFYLGKSKTNPKTWTVFDAAGNQAVNANGDLIDNLTDSWDDGNDANDYDKYGGFDIKEDGAGSVLLKTVRSNFSTGNFYNRNIYTSVDGKNMVKVSRSSLSTTDLGVGSNNERDKLVNYIYGYTNDADLTDDAFPIATRDWVLGSIVHSKPLIIDYYDPSDLSKLDTRYIVIGSNDGMLHVFDDTPNSGIQGKEVFAFIPSDLLIKMKDLPGKDLVEMVDGGSMLYRSDSQPKYLIFGEGRGGNKYWCLDISNKSPLSWKIKWNYSNPAMGQSWGDMRAATIPVSLDKTTGAVTFKDVVIFSGGYDTEEDYYPEPFLDTDHTGTPYSSGTTINANKWSATNPTQDTNGNGIYDVFNPGENEYGRGIFIVDVEDPTLTTKTTLKISGEEKEVTLLPFQVTKATVATASPYSNQQTRTDMKYCFPAAPSIVVGTYNYYYKSGSSLLSGQQPNALISIYATDIYANVFRVNFDFGSKTLKETGNESDYSKWTWEIENYPWSINRIFSANPGSISPSGVHGLGVSTTDKGRKAFYSPSISWGGSCDFFDKGNYYFPNTVFSGTKNMASLLFGTGDREHPSYKLVKDRFYSVYDDSTVNAKSYDAGGLLLGNVDVTTISYTENNLLNLTCDELDQDSSASTSTKSALKTLLTDNATYLDSSVEKLENGVHENDAKGWYVVLQDQSACSSTSLNTSTTDSRDNHEGEKVLSPATLYANIVYFTTYQPASTDPCDSQGNGFTYSLDYCTATATYNLNTTNDPVNKKKTDLTDRYNKYTHIFGIPSGFSVVTLNGEAGAMAMMGGKIIGAQGANDLKIKSPGHGLELFYWRESNSQQK